MSPTDMDTEMRSGKSMDCVMEDPSFTKMEKKAGLKTPWSKVKNIIQTRRGSLKRRTVPGVPRFSDDELEDEPVWRDSRFREHPKKLPVLTLTMPSTDEAEPGAMQHANKGYLAPVECQPRKETFQRKVKNSFFFKDGLK
jgi:hypothetical protein